MKHLAICIAAIILVSCGSSQNKNKAQGNDETKINVKLEMLWETAPLLRTPESVLADKSRGVLYVSNMNRDAEVNSASGYISKVGMDGNIVELKWVEGLNGPKGMGLFGNNLFVSDFDEIVKIDIESGKIVERTKIEGNPNLNDVTVGSDGSVYVTGYDTDIIYRVKDGVVESVFTGTQGGENFNGLLWEKDRILLITSSSSIFKSIDWDTFKVTVLAEEMGHGDGIASVGNGDYITSDWRGRIFYIPAKGETITLLDTREQEINTADIDYIIESNTLYVPTFYKNTLRAYKVIIE